jgi:protoheme IX farnesyltransferase
LIANKNILIENIWIGKIYDYGVLAKFKLTSFILLSAAAGYGLAVNGNFNTLTFISLLIGGFLVTGSSNAINQILERNFDALMERTAQRPLASERMSLMEAMVAAGLAGILGVLILWFYCNALCGIVGALALLSYAFVYTPLKRISPISVWVGAIPGALPPMIGVLAAHNAFDQMAITMFAIQFLWQFPHFWAIAWVSDEDYTKAGYKMLPSSGGKDRVTAMFSITYSLLLIPIGMLPTYFGWTGNIAMVINILMGVMMTVQAIILYIRLDNKSAKALMFSSFIYLPVVLLALVLNKI